MTLRDDDEVCSVKFGGDDFDTLDIFIPELLCKFLHGPSLELDEKDIVVHVSCGSVHGEGDWLDLLDDCITSLSELIETTSPGCCTTEEEFTASTQSFSGIFHEYVNGSGCNPLQISKSFSDCSSLPGNLSFKSAGASYAAYASFYDASFTEEASIGDINHNGSHGKLSTVLPPKATRETFVNFCQASIGKLSESLLNDSTGRLAAADVPKVPKAA
jgi:hypothetical protein